MENYETTQDERLWAMLSYLLSLLTGFVAPLVIYIVKRDGSRFVAFHALQAVFVNLVTLVAIIILQALFNTLPELGHLLYYLWVLISTATLIYQILGAIKAWD